jgi:hypothetical protein
MPTTSDTRVVLLGADGAGGVMTGVTTGQSMPQSCLGHTLLTVFLSSQGAISGGPVIIEEADYDPRTGVPYTGTWSQIQSVPVTGFSGGGQQAIAMGPRVFSYLRVRLGAPITGGTISATLRMT